MANLEQDFDLQILKAGDGYRINVLQSPAGEADGEFSLPISEIALNEMFRGLGQVRKATRGAAAPEVAKAREFGTLLFDKVFSGDVRDCLNASRGSARAAGANLRIRLRLTKVPELLDLPWELLFDRRYNRFVALDGSTTLVRHLPVAEPVVPMRVEPPLRVLVAISNPRGDLNVDQEWANLSQALTGVQARGLMQVERLQAATFESLQAKLATSSFHVLHFIGHGYYDAASQNGYLSFEATNSGEKRVGATRLADLLRPHRTLRLVLLNSCEGGRTSRDDPFAGVAQSLVQSAIPAVVAMQFPVTDMAAVIFAGAFYGGFAEGRPVDLAVADARREVNLRGEEGDIEWATPVLYMRSDGRLFDVDAGMDTAIGKTASMRQTKTSEENPYTRITANIGPTKEVRSESIPQPKRSLPKLILILGAIVLVGGVIVGVIDKWTHIPGPAGPSTTTETTPPSSGPSVAPPPPPKQASGPSVAPTFPSTTSSGDRTTILPTVVHAGKTMLLNLDKTRNTSTEFDYWPNGGIRIAYHHLATFGSYETLSKLSPHPIFVSGPHQPQRLNLESRFNFGYYNPAFLRWFEDHLLEILQDRTFIGMTRGLFKKYLGGTAMIYWKTYTALQENPNEMNVLLQDYKTRMADRTLPAGYYYNLAWEEAEKRFAFLKSMHARADSNVVASAVYFWLRRRIDGTDKHMFSMLEELLVAYQLIEKPSGLYYKPGELPRTR